MPFGKFSQVTFVDTTSPPINADNLNELERVVALCDSELARTNDINFGQLKEYFFERNTYVFIYFIDYTDWTNQYPSQTDLSDEQDDQLIGNDALKMENLLNTAGWMSIYQTLVATQDLTTFYDGSSSSTSDVILFFFYMSDGNAFQALQIRLGDDAANSYFIDLSAYIATGWVAVYPTKADFTTLGSPTGWNSIDYVRIAPYVYAGYQNEYILFQYMMLCRVDPVYSGYSNCFQKYYGTSTGWQNVFTIPTDFCSLHRDHRDFIEKIGYMKLDAEQDLTQLLVQTDMIQFMSKWEFYCKYAGESASIIWYYNSSNYAEVYISSDVFYLLVNEAGTPTSTSKSLAVGLIKDERFYIYFEKQDDTFRAILKKDGESIKILEYETSIDSTYDGNIYLGQHSANSYAFLTDFILGNKKINDLQDENLPRMVKMFQDQAFTNNSITNVLGLYAYLPTNKYFKIDLYLVCSCSNATPNVKIAWDLTGCFNYTNRNVIGPASGITDASNATVKITEFGMSSEIEYGIEAGADESLIRETFIVLCEYDGGKIQLQAAQQNTDGSNPTTIKATSFILITPINAQANTNT